MKDSKQIDAKYVAIRDFYNKMIELGVRLPAGFDSWMQAQDVIPMYDYPSGIISGRMVLASESKYTQD